MKPKWPRMLTKSVLLHQNNMPVHKSLVTTVFSILDGGFEMVDNPTYSPDLAPSDNYLFPDMKKI